jgi:ZIP family zinc transporter
VLEAAFWGFVGGFALIIGAVLGVALRVPRRLIGVVMAFGAGVLISALAFDLTAEALEASETWLTAGGLAAGSVSFFLGDAWLDRRGGGDRKRSHGRQSANPALGLVLGAVLDGIPESVVIGVSLLDERGVSAMVVVAVFLSNVPESLSAATGLRDTWPAPRILALWACVALVAAASAALGYVALEGASQDPVAFCRAFAAGAILTMLVDTMIPEAFEAEQRSKTTGLVTTAGFALAVVLSQL